MKRNSVYNVLSSLVIVAVFACVSCSHRRDVNIDGGLLSDNSETTEQNVGADASSTNPEANLATSEEKQEAQASASSSEEQAQVPVEEKTEAPAASGDVSLLEIDGATLPSSESASADSGDLNAIAGAMVASNETPSEPTAEPVFNTDSAIPVDAPIVSATTESTEPVMNPEPPAAPAPKAARAHKTKRAEKAKRSSHSAVKAPARVETVQIEPQQNSQVEAPKPVIESSRTPARVDEDEVEEVKPEPQVAGAGIESFIEKNAFWIASLLVGFVITVFFYVRRKKEDDNHMAM